MRDQTCLIYRYFSNSLWILIQHSYRFELILGHESESHPAKTVITLHQETFWWSQNVGFLFLCHRFDLFSELDLSNQCSEQNSEWWFFELWPWNRHEQIVSKNGFVHKLWYQTWLHCHSHMYSSIKLSDWQICMVPLVVVPDSGILYLLHAPASCDFHLIDKI